MPEGPSLVIAAEAINGFKGKKIITATGSAAINKSLFANKKITDIKTWGKHLLICLPHTTIRIHFLMFGSYSINELTKKQSSIRLHLQFAKDHLNFYTCSVKLIEGDINDTYDWSGDVLNDKWSAAKAKKKLKDIPGTMVCDALLNQEIFAGVGNIIKNEVLYRIEVDPHTLIGDLPPRKLNELVKEARNYSFDFLQWKKDNVLKKHWLAYAQKTCKRCNLPFKSVNLGKTNRRTFYCTNCQVLY